MNLRLRTIIALACFSVVFVFLLGVAFIMDAFVFGELTEKHVILAEDGVEQLSDKSEIYVKNNLLSLSCDFIDLYAEDMSKVLAPIVKHIGEQSPNKIQNNKKLRRLVCMPTMYRGQTFGFASLMSSDGVLLIDPNPEVESTNIADWKEKFPDIWRIYRRGLKNKKAGGYYKFWSNTQWNEIEEKYMSMVIIPGTNYFICTYFDVDVICDPLDKEFANLEREHLLKIKKQIKKNSDDISEVLKYGLLGLMLLLLFVCIVCSWYVAYRVTKPITSLNSAAKKMGDGDFETTVEGRGSLEINELAGTFNNLGSKLMEYMKTLEQQITLRQRFESELKIASDIQKSLLRRDGLPDIHKNASVFATLYPAKNVAGDFYDYFYLDEEKEKIVVLMADVSGKGIYAAIFMAMAKTVIRNLCQEYSSPDKVLKKANNLYLNSTNMFVTMFLGYYDIKTGILEYANAGHHAALHLTADGKLKEFGVYNDSVLGLFPDNEYQSGKEQFYSDEKLFLYTDGLTEAVNKKTESFGEERMKNLLLEHRNIDSEKICSELLDAVIKFEEGERFDDITMLVLKRIS